MMVGADADGEACIEKLTGELWSFAKTVNNQGRDGFTRPLWLCHIRLGFGNDLAPKFDTVDNDGFVQCLGGLECRAKGGELQVEGCGTEPVETTFADGDKVRIVAVLFHST